jgi:hypothetical protein
MASLPSDDAPAVVACGRTNVRVSMVSMSARAPDGSDAAYLAWHGLDHLPEQYRIPGVRLGARWVSTPACRAARAASSARYDAVDHVVQYLFAEPVAESLDAFFALGAALRAARRMAELLPSVELAGYLLDAITASPRVLVGADVLPWRPARGVYLLIEEDAGVPESLLAVPGVAGLWTWSGISGVDARLASTRGQRLTVAYLDDDPVRTAALIADALAARATSALLAAPFQPVVPWRWDAALPG